jgi:hypothetical protein
MLQNEINKTTGKNRKDLTMIILPANSKIFPFLNGARYKY